MRASILKVVDQTCVIHFQKESLPLIGCAVRS